MSKAISLGLEIPAGFVITCNALNLFLQKNGLLSPIQKWLTAYSLMPVSEGKKWYRDLCQQVMAAPIPEEVMALVEPAAEALLLSAVAGLAVRSSGIHEDAEKTSFAGVYDSFLGITSMGALWEAVRQCWCSAWSLGALDYARKMSVDLKPSGMAVVVQELVPAERSGVIFTANPLTGNPWEFVLNSTFGLAEALISGRVPADRFVLAWDTGEVLKQTVVAKEAILQGTKEGLQTIHLPHEQRDIPSLTGEALTQVWQLALELDRAFDQRVDVEWAMANQKLYLIQVRPITALPAFFPHDLTGADAGVTWTPLSRAWDISARIDDKLISPLFQDRLALEMWQRHLPANGIFVRRQWQERDFNGYRYTTEWVWIVDGYDDEGKIAWLEQHEGAIRKLWLTQVERARQGRGQAADKQKTAHRAADLIPTLLSLRELETDTIAASWAAPQWMIFICERLLKVFLKEIAPDFAVGTLLQGLTGYSYERTKAAQKLGNDIDEKEVRQAFMERALDDVVPYLMAQYPDCHFLADYERFCFQVGLPPLTWPKPWLDDLDKHNQILFTIKKSMLGQSQSIEAIQAACAAARKENVAELRRHIIEFDVSMLERFEWLLALAQFWTPALDNRFGVVAPLQIRLLDVIRQTGRMLVQEGLLDSSTELFLLTPDDLTQIASAEKAMKYRPDFLKQRHEHERNRRLVPPPFLGAPPKPSPPEELVEFGSNEDSPRHPTSAKIFRGDGLAPGRVIGFTRKVMDLSDAASLDSLTNEHILVYPGYTTWPDWLSLLMVVKGLVTVQGVQLHHATQLARECGVPYINLTQAEWDRIPDNVNVALDGKIGLVKVL